MPRDRIVIAGGSGFIGRALAAQLAACGDDVIILTRSPGASSGLTDAGFTSEHADLRRVLESLAR